MTATFCVLYIVHRVNPPKLGPKPEDLDWRLSKEVGGAREEYTTIQGCVQCFGCATVAVFRDAWHQKITHTTIHAAFCICFLPGLQTACTMRGGGSMWSATPRCTALRARRPVRTWNGTWLLPTAQAPWQPSATRRVLSRWSRTLVSQGPKCRHVCRRGTRAFCEFANKNAATRSKMRLQWTGMAHVERGN